MIKAKTHHPQLTEKKLTPYPILKNQERSTTNRKWKGEVHPQQLKIKLAGQTETTPYTLNASGR